MPEILTIQQVVTRAKGEGWPLSEYTIRRAVKSGAIPCRVVGRRYLIAWGNVRRWLLCEEGQDNLPAATGAGGIRQQGVIG